MVGILLGHSQVAAAPRQAYPLRNSVKASVSAMADRIGADLRRTDNVVTER